MKSHPGRRGLIETRDYQAHHDPLQAFGGVLFFWCFSFRSCFVSRERRQALWKGNCSDALL